MSLIFCVQAGTSPMETKRFLNNAQDGKRVFLKNKSRVTNVLMEPKV